jgi:predicted nucleic acid-binding protein
MKPTAHLVDSAAYIDLMRAGKDPRQVLAPMLRAGLLYNCGVVRAEVLRGIRIEKHRVQMEAFFDIIPEVPTTAHFWREVAELGWKLGRKGKWPPVSNLAIARAALTVKAVVVSPDGHFRDIPGLKVVESI